jgi:hypothetical protein
MKTWQWVKETVCTDGPALIKYFDDDPARAGTLWPGDGGMRLREGSFTPLGSCPSPCGYWTAFGGRVGH